MRPSKVVLIGAGSASFGLSSLGALLREPDIDGSTLALVDLNERNVTLMHRLAERVAREWGRQVTIQSTTDQRKALPGADFVAVSIETGPRETLWRQDYELTLSHGLRQPYAENGGPGGFAHTLRNLPPIMDIAADMADLCPDAWLINLTNPLPRLCRAVTRYTDVKTVGLCHGIFDGYVMLGLVFAEEIGLERPPVLLDGAPYAMADAIGWDGVRRIRERALDALSIRSAGLNHFVWALDIRLRATGEDLYPRLAEKLAALPDTFDPLAREMYRVLGCIPLPGDTHVCEYLPWMTNAQRKPWERYAIQLYRWDQHAQGRDEMWHEIEAAAAGKAPLDRLRAVTSEGVYEVVSGIAGDRNLYQEAVNIANQGHITNLPAGTIVEVPGLINADGVNGVGVGDLPPLVAELCRREAALVELIVQAGVEGDRDAALQALLFDPHVDDIALARDILKTYLEAYAEWLPQFHGAWRWDGGAKV